MLASVTNAGISTWSDHKYMGLFPHGSMLEAQLAAEDHAFARLIAAAAQLKPQHQEALRALEETR